MGHELQTVVWGVVLSTPRVPIHVYTTQHRGCSSIIWSGVPDTLFAWCQVLLLHEGIWIKKRTMHCRFRVFIVLTGEKISYPNSEVFNIRSQSCFQLLVFDVCFKAVSHKAFVAVSCLNRMSALGGFTVAPGSLTHTHTHTPFVYLERDSHESRGPRHCFALWGAKQIFVTPDTTTLSK